MPLQVKDLGPLPTVEEIEASRDRWRARELDRLSRMDDEKLFKYIEHELNEQSVYEIELIRRLKTAKGIQ